LPATSLIVVSARQKFDLLLWVFNPVTNKRMQVCAEPFRIKPSLFVSLRHHTELGFVWKLPGKEIPISRVTPP